MPYLETGVGYQKPTQAKQRQTVTTKASLRYVIECINCLRKHQYHCQRKILRSY